MSDEIIRLFVSFATTSTSITLSGTVFGMIIIPVLGEIDCGFT